jgi:nitrous oxidase accessory protein
MGEARESTIIDGNHSGSVVVLRANNIELSGFTIQGCGTNYSNPDSGIWSYGTQLQSLKIFNNILKNNSIGVSLSYCQKISIMKNIFIGNIEGLWVVASKQIIFTENLMEHNVDAISFLDLSFSIFSYNTISDNGFGIGGGGLHRCLLFYHNIIHANTYGIMIDAITFTSFIIKNEFSNNSIGLFIGDGLGVRVKGNTFLSNDIDASFESFFLTLLVPIRIAVFRHNYWDKTTWPIPEIIRGELMSYSGYNYYYYNWFLFDWFPALYRHVIKNNHAG